MEHLWGITHLRKKFLWGITHIRKKNLWGITHSAKILWGTTHFSGKIMGYPQNQKIEKCDPPPYHDLLMTAPLQNRYD